jgi:hypothetical protein
MTIDKDPSERFPIAFAIKGLAAAETIVSAVVSVSLEYGADALPSTLLVGDPVTGEDGDTVTQVIAFGVAGATYKLKLTATTSADNVLVSTVAVRVRPK